MMQGDSQSTGATPNSGAASSIAEGSFFDRFTDPQVLLEFGSKALILLVFLFAGWLVSIWLARLTQRMMEKARVDLTLTRFAGKAIRWSVLLFVVLGCLSYFGIEMTSIAALIAAMGLAIGLAFQGSLSNLAAGTMLLIFRPFKIGDVVKIGGQKGTVYEIDILATALDTPDNRRVIVPNGSIFGTTIENVTYHATRRVDVSVGVEYSASVDGTRNVLEKAAASIENTIADPPMQIVLCDLGTSSVDWQVKVWCGSENYWSVRECLVRAVKIALDDAGIGIAYPQMDVHLDHAPVAT